MTFLDRKLNINWAGGKENFRTQSDVKYISGWRKALSLSLVFVVESEKRFLLHHNDGFSYREWFYFVFQCCCCVLWWISEFSSPSLLCSHNCLSFYLYFSCFTFVGRWKMENSFSETVVKHECSSLQCRNRANGELRTFISCGCVGDAFPHIFTTRLCVCLCVWKCRCFHLNFYDYKFALVPLFSKHLFVEVRCEHLYPNAAAWRREMLMNLLLMLILVHFTLFLKWCLLVRTITIPPTRWWR